MHPQQLHDFKNFLTAEEKYKAYTDILNGKIDVSNPIVPELQDVFFLSKYKIKKTDENNHAVEGNLKDGEIEKFRRIFVENCDKVKLGFEIYKVLRRQSNGGGGRLDGYFDYTVTVVKTTDTERLRIAKTEIIKELKTLKIQKGDFIKKEARENYADVNFVRAMKLLSFLYKIS